jgi:hypothetical protein
MEPNAILFALSRRQSNDALNISNASQQPAFNLHNGAEVSYICALIEVHQGGAQAFEEFFGRLATHSSALIVTQLFENLQ